MENLSSDIWVRIYSHLKPSEIIKSQLTSKRLQSCCEHQHYVWRSYVDGHHDPGFVNQIKNFTKNEQDSLAYYKNVAKAVQASTELNKLNWDNIIYLDGKSSSKFKPMECHAACLLQERYLVVVEGWGASGNNLDIIDASKLPTIRKVKTTTRNLPSFRYSFTAVSCSDTKIIIYGGFRSGGYSADVSDVYFLNLSFDVMEPGSTESEEMSVTATYSIAQTNNNNASNRSSSSNASVTAAPLSRGFHSALVLPLNLVSAPAVAVCNSSRRPSSITAPPVTSQNYMLVFGGISHRRAVARLQAFHIEEKYWIDVPTQGVEPEPRFGHSCLLMQRPLDKVRRLIFTGGSNGSDLLRNGIELKEIHILTIIPPPTAPTAIGIIGEERRIGNGLDTLVWSTPILRSDPSSFASYNDYENDPRRIFPGRCHCACLVGNSVIMFGGGAANSNDIVVADLTRACPYNYVMPSLSSVDIVTTETVSHSEEYVLIKCPKVTGKMPIERIGGVAVQVGKWMFIQGGWHNRCSELGDVQLLDLTFGRSNTATTAVATNSCYVTDNPPVMMINDDDDEEEDNEAEAEVRDPFLHPADYQAGFNWSTILSMYGILAQDFLAHTNNNINDDEDEEEEEDDEDIYNEYEYGNLQVEDEEQEMQEEEETNYSEEGQDDDVDDESKND